MSAELLHWLWKATLAVSLAGSCVAIARLILRRWLGSEAIYALWLMLPLALAVSFVPDPPAVVRSVNSFPSPAVDGGTPNSVPIAASAWKFDSAALALWPLGFAACLIGMSIRQRRFVHRLAIRRECDARLSASTGLRVHRADAADAAPALIGAWRPRLVLPQDFERRYTIAEQQVVLLHERVHARRADSLANAAFAAARCVFWFNPLLHALAGLCTRDQELACDAAVVRELPRARRAYAEALLKTSDVCGALPVGCHWQSVHPLKERIMLLNRTLPGRRQTWLARIAVASLLAASTWSALAVLPAPAEKIVVAAPQSFDITMQLSSNGKLDAHPRLTVRDGEPAGVHIDGDHPWALDVRVSDLDGRKFSLSAVVKAGAALKVIGTPELRDNYGQPVSFEVADGAARYRAEFRVVATQGSTVAASPSASPAHAGSAAPAPLPLPTPSAVASTTPSSASLPAASATAMATAAADAHPVAGGTASAAGEPSAYLRATPPTYPLAAVRQKIEGKVVLRVQVLADGSAGRIEVASATPPGVFDQASIDAVKTWKFKPERGADGKAVDAWVEVPIEFTQHGAAPTAR